MGAGQNHSCPSPDQTVRSSPASRLQPVKLPQALGPSAGQMLVIPGENPSPQGHPPLGFREQVGGAVAVGRELQARPGIFHEPGSSSSLVWAGLPSQHLRQQACRGNGLDMGTGLARGLLPAWFSLCTETASVRSAQRQRREVKVVYEAQQPGGPDSRRWGQARGGFQQRLPEEGQVRGLGSFLCLVQASMGPLFCRVPCGDALNPTRVLSSHRA